MGSQVVKELLPLAASRIDACRLTDARWSAKPQSARRAKKRAPLLPPNRARFGQQSRTTAPKTPEKRAKKFRILITPFARFEAAYDSPIRWKTTASPATGREPTDPLGWAIWRIVSPVAHR